MSWIFVSEMASTRSTKGMLHFVGRADDKDIAYIGVTGMDKRTPEVQITVAEHYRRQGYGREMLAATIQWLFENTGKEVFLYRTIVGNTGSEELVHSIGGVLRPAGNKLEMVMVKTYEIQPDPVCLQIKRDTEL